MAKRLWLEYTRRERSSKGAELRLGLAMYGSAGITDGTGMLMSGPPAAGTVRHTPTRCGCVIGGSTGMAVGCWWKATGGS